MITIIQGRPREVRAELCRVLGKIRLPRRTRFVRGDGWELTLLRGCAVLVRS